MLSKLIDKFITISSDSEEKLFELILQSIPVRTLAISLARYEKHVRQIDLKPTALSKYQICRNCIKSLDSICTESLQSGSILVWQLREIEGKKEDFIECAKALHPNRSKEKDFRERLLVLIKNRNDELSQVQNQARLLKIFITKFAKLKPLG